MNSNQNHQPTLEDSHHTVIKRKRTSIYCPYGTVENCAEPEVCTYDHPRPSKSSTFTLNDIEYIPPKCGICLEPCHNFGVLVHCHHDFCISCIRGWRARSQDYKVVSVFTSCPTCRQYSPFIIPLATTNSVTDKRRLVREYSEFLERLTPSNRTKLQAYIKGDLPYYPCPNPVISHHYNSHQYLDTEAEQNTRAYRIYPTSSAASTPPTNPSRGIFSTLLIHLKIKLGFLNRILPITDGLPSTHQ